MRYSVACSKVGKSGDGNNMIEYIVILTKEQSEKLVKLSEAAGEDNELVWLDNKIEEWLDER